MRQETDELRVVIPMPVAIAFKRGAQSVAPMSAPLRARIATDDLEIVKYAAIKCGTTVAEFVRWCAVHVAVKIKEYHDGKPHEPDASCT